MKKLISWLRGLRLFNPKFKSKNATIVSAATTETPPKTEVKQMDFKLDFTNAEINIMLSALSKQPYDQVAALIEKILAEVKKQVENTEGK